MSTSRPTIHDVAQAAGTSKSLVSLALSGSPRVSAESRERIMNAATRLGYRPNAAARNLVARRSRTIGVLILDLHNPVFAEILDGVHNEVRQQGFSTMLVSGGEDPKLEQAEIDTLLEFQIEGLILISHRLSATAIHAIAGEVPTVIVSRDDVAGPRVDTVCNDDVAGAAMAVDYLVDLGHRDITCLSGGDNPISLERARGYREAMRSHGLDESVRVVPGGLTDTAGYDAAIEALAHNPTALVVANDLSAMGAIAAVTDSGKSVPTDVSVIGYDGIRLGNLHTVNLTTVAQPLADLGRLAAQRVMERITSPNSESQRTRVDANLVVRGTTGPPLTR